MPQDENHSFTKASVRLEFEPSERLANTLGLFINDEHRYDSDEGISIKSLGAFYVSLYGASSLIRPSPYETEPHDEPKIEEKIRNFETSRLKPISDQRMSLASFVKIEYIPHNPTTILMRVLPSEEQSHVFDKFGEIPKSYAETLLHKTATPKDSVEYVVFRVPSVRANLAKSAFILAKGELESLLKPSEKTLDISEYRQSFVSLHDDDVFVSVKPTLAITRTSSPAIDSRHSEPSIA